MRRRCTTHRLASRRVEERLRAFAKQGKPEQMIQLAQLLLSGHGVKANRAEAVEWLRQAAALGDRRASGLLAQVGDA